MSMFTERFAHTCLPNSIESRTTMLIRIGCMKEEQPAAPNPEKDPDDWTTGDERMTGPQMSYLKTLCQEANEEFDENLTKAGASKRIDELRKRTGRGDS